MLGVYESFPENVHKIADFAALTPTKKLQQTLIQTLRKLNEAASLDGTADSAMSQCAVIFEFGIAEGSDFNYLDDEEVSRVMNNINRKPFPILDFLLVTRYYKTQEQKRRPLRFDYYMLRFIFDRHVEIRVFHEKGPMRMLPEEISDFVVERINETVSKGILKPLEAS
ncbi:hypothetical protein MUO83_09750 [Candidatus Bathyarchaeota archaeon]|jgi:hypothetical protein|nr:hypothetical protein [Candidatus Bathyarchaeota archaeon]